MSTILQWLFNFLKDGALALSYVTDYGFDIGGYHFTMLTLLSIGGLFTYLGVAITMWALK